MGTRVTLVISSGTSPRGNAQLERMLALLEQTDAVLSTWRPDSEISRLHSAVGEAPTQLTAATCSLLSEAGRLAAYTGGAFDPVVGALVEAWDLHGAGRVPTRHQLESARAHSGWHRVRLDSERCTLSMPVGVSLDVGAFGKGEALDRVRREAPVVEPWLIDLGGQIAVSGAPPGMDGWEVAIAHPRDRRRAAIPITLTAGSLATSGGERDLDVTGTRVGHLLDPRTGAPAPFGGSVSVWAEQALVADALSTALFVMGPDDGLPWADANAVAALFLQIDPGGELRRRPSLEFTRRFGVPASD